MRVDEALAIPPRKTDPEEAALVTPDGAEPATGATEVDSNATRFGPPDPFSDLDVRLHQGETLFQALLRGGLGRAEAARIVDALDDRIDFRRLRPGDRLEGTLWRDHELISGVFRHGRLERYGLDREEGEVVARYDPIPIRRVTEAVAGRVATSLFQAVYEVGERPQLIMNFVELFQWSFDFSLEARPGDRFEVLFEKEYAEGDMLGYGRILAARYRTGDEDLEACWFPGVGEEREHSGYFHPDGRSVRRAFLRSPVEFGRISSGYRLDRRHPVLGYSRPHRGIDYAAPTGTLVYSVGDGVVVDARWMGGAGRTVRVRHPNGWVTSYSHLSRILVRKGTRVRQGQRVGRIGSSGLATGPHLHFAVKIGGDFRNWKRLTLPAGDPVPAAARAPFEDACSMQLEALDDALAGEGAVVAARE